MTISVSLSRCPAYRLKFLPLRCSLCDKCSRYLNSYYFIVSTNSNLFIYVLTKYRLDSYELLRSFKLACKFIQHIIYNALVSNACVFYLHSSTSQTPSKQVTGITLHFITQDIHSLSEKEWNMKCSLNYGVLNAPRCSSGTAEKPYLLNAFCTNILTVC